MPTARARVAVTLLLSVTPERLPRHLERLRQRNPVFFGEVLRYFLQRAELPAVIAAWAYLLSLADEQLDY